MGVWGERGGRRGFDPIRGAAGVGLADPLDHCGRGRRAKLGKLPTAADRFRHVAARAWPIAEPVEKLRIRGGQEVDHVTFERAPRSRALPPWLLPCRFDATA